MNAVFSAALELQSFCRQQSWRFCFIGGVALQRWGEPRQTVDVDVTLLTGFGDEESFVDLLLARFAGRRSDAREFALRHRVLLLQNAAGVGLDVALGGLPFEADAVERGSEFVIGDGQSIFTCSAGLPPLRSRGVGYDPAPSGGSSTGGARAMGSRAKRFLLKGALAFGLAAWPCTSSGQVAASVAKPAVSGLERMAQARTAQQDTLKAAEDAVGTTLSDLLANEQDEAKRVRIDAELKLWRDGKVLPSASRKATRAFEKAREDSFVRLLDEAGKARTELDRQGLTAEMTRLDEELVAIRKQREAARWRDLRCGIESLPVGWSRLDGALVQSGKEHSAVVVGLEPIEQQGAFIVRLTATRVSGTGDLKLVFPSLRAGKALSGALFLGGWDGQTSGLAWIDDHGANDNATTSRAPVFTEGKPTSLWLEVGPDAIHVKRDDKALIDWKQSGGSLDLPDEFEQQLSRAKWPNSLVLITSADTTFRVDECAFLALQPAPKSVPKPAPIAKAKPQDKGTALAAENLLPAGVRLKATWTETGPRDGPCASIEVESSDGRTATIKIGTANGARFRIVVAITGKKLELRSIEHTKNAGSGSTNLMVFSNVNTTVGTVDVKGFALGFTFDRVQGQSRDSSTVKIRATRLP